MFDFHSVTIDDFKSFAGHHHFIFPTEPGLYYLTGENRVEPRLESNGAGKSTVLDAVYWCLYGRTVRGLRSGDVVNWNSQGCAVSLHMTAGTKTFTVTRAQNPNHLEVDGQPVDQETLQKHILLGDEAFLYSVAMPQHNQSFLELTPTNKLTLFSQIMELDYWLKCSQTAATKTAQIREQMLLLKQIVLSLNEQIIGSDAELTELTEKEKTFDKEQRGIVVDLNENISLNEQERGDLQEVRANLESGIKNRSVSHQEKTLEMESVEAARSRHFAYRDSLNEMRVEARTKLIELTAAQHSLSEMTGTCPTCLQKIDGKHVKAEEKRLNAAVTEQQQIIDDTDQKLKVASRFLTKAEKDLRELVGAVALINRNTTQDQKNLTLAESDINAVNSRIASIKKQISTEQKRDNPYSRMLTAKQKAVTKLTSDLTLHKATLEELAGADEAVSFWVAGFKRLRLFLIEETLLAFELEVNNGLTSLGLEDWKIEFDVDRENKSGGVTKGFVVFVRNSVHPEPVRFEAWSGGEGQRLQLAGDLGLANLIMLQAGLRGAIEFYDEPSKHLSRAGLMDLAETLHQRALTDNKKIFLIDHHTMEFGEFVATIKVIKDEKGSSFGTTAS